MERCSPILGVAHQTWRIQDTIRDKFSEIKRATFVPSKITTWVCWVPRIQDRSDSDSWSTGKPGAKLPIWLVQWQFMALKVPDLEEFRELVFQLQNRNLPAKNCHPRQWARNSRGRCLFKEGGAQDPNCQNRAAFESIIQKAVQSQLSMYSEFQWIPQALAALPMAPQRQDPQSVCWMSPGSFDNYNTMSSQDVFRIENPKHCNDRISMIFSETAGEFTESGKSEHSFHDGRRIIRTRKPMVMYMISTSLHRVRLITEYKTSLVSDLYKASYLGQKSIPADRRRQAARFARLASGTHAGGTRISWRWSSWSCFQFQCVSGPKGCHQYKAIEATPVAKKRCFWSWNCWCPSSCLLFAKNKEVTLKPLTTHISDMCEYFFSGFRYQVIDPDFWWDGQGQYDRLYDFLTWNKKWREVKLSLRLPQFGGHFSQNGFLDERM